MALPPELKKYWQPIAANAGRANIRKRRERGTLDRHIQLMNKKRLEKLREKKRQQEAEGE